MKKTLAVIMILIFMFATGCASVPKHDAAAGNYTEKEKREQAIGVNILDTVLGAVAGMFAGTLCGGFITVATRGWMWNENLDAGFYVPIFVGTVAGGFTGYLLSPKYAE